MSSRIKEFRIDLKGQYLQYYEAIKEINNIGKKVDVFRHALERTYEVEMEDTTPYTIIDASLKRRIIQLTKREDVRKKYGLYRYEDFLLSGIHMLLESIEQFVGTRSILHWDVRHSLQGDSKDVALVIKELLIQDPNEEVKFSSILNKLGWRNEYRLKEILDDFVYKNLLASDIFGNERIYHAIIPR